MLYLVLSIVLFILAFLLYIKFNKDILSISALTALVYGVSSFGAFLANNSDSWNHHPLHFNTFIIIIIGVLSTFLGELFIYNRRKKEQVNNDYRYEPIKIDILKTFICIIFVIMTILFVFNNMKSITGEAKIPAVLSSYRESTEIFNSNAADNEKINTIFMQMYRICEIIGLIYIYVIIRNIFAKDKMNILNFILIFLCIALTFLLSGRSGFIKYIIESFAIWIILYNKSRKLNVRRFVRASIKIGIITIPIFYFILPLLGRKTGANFIDYITFYIGSPIASFDALMQKGITHSLEFGNLTLKGLQGILSKFGMYSNYSIFSTDWIYFKPGLSSNVFTSYYAPYKDFGYLGIIVCPLLFGYIFSRIYSNAKENSDIRFLLIYAFFANLVIDQFRTEKLFTVFLSYTTLIYILILFVMCWILFDIKTINGKK